MNDYGFPAGKNSALANEDRDKIIRPDAEAVETETGKKEAAMTCHDRETACLKRCNGLAETVQSEKNMV